MTEREAEKKVVRQGWVGGNGRKVFWQAAEFGEDR